jgi:hypothetical protein
VRTQAGKNSLVTRRRLVLSLVGVAFAVTALLAVMFATVIRQDESPEVVRSIDVIRGTYHGVGIGDDPAAVRRVFGPRLFARMDKEPYIPTNANFAEVGGPAVLNHPCKPPRQLRGGRPRLTVLRYEEVSFLFCDGRAFALMVIARDASTWRGLRIGDDLDKALTLYAGLTCADAPSGDFGEYPYCAGSIASPRSAPPLHVWFGEDPIASITISTTGYDGYER